MRKQPRLTLPFPSTSTVQEPELCTSASDLVLNLDFDDDGRNAPSCLRFRKQRAFRNRAEAHCTAWHVEGVYDTVCEVEASNWVEELRATTAPEWREFWTLRHFIVYIDGFGCLEVVAESVELEEQT